MISLKRYSFLFVAVAFFACKAQVQRKVKPFIVERKVLKAVRIRLFSRGVGRRRFLFKQKNKWN
jgi:hypothetical protein